MIRTSKSLNQFLSGQVTRTEPSGSGSSGDINSRSYEFVSLRQPPSLFKYAQACWARRTSQNSAPGGVSLRNESTMQDECSA
jgi:hypothetical protein